MTEVQMQSGADVVAFLKSQHEQVKASFQKVLSTHGEARADAFVELRRLLAVHETAEEEIVHPRARKEIAGGDAIIDARLHEEESAKRALTELEGMDVDSEQFITAFTQLQTDVIAHAEAEETQEFSKLAAELDTDQLERMTRAVRLAESTAPTRPHPGVESQGKNMMVGPFAAMLDRARDAIGGKG